MTKATGTSIPLAPCPFCQSHNVFLSTGSKNIHSIMIKCRSCYAVGPKELTGGADHRKAAAIRKWNQVSWIPFERGMGKTTRQMMNLAVNGLFICATADLKYEKRLANEIGRSDILFRSKDFVLREQFHGMEFSDATFDHAIPIMLQRDEFIQFQLYWNMLVTKVRRKKEVSQGNNGPGGKGE